MTDKNASRAPLTPPQENSPDSPALSESTAPTVETSPPEAPPVASIPTVDASAPHGLKTDGTPAKKRGRPPKSDTDQRERLASVTPKPVRPQPTVAPVAMLADYNALGEQAANLWFGVGCVLLGDDWQPDTEQGEHVAVSGAFRDYFKASGVVQIPPSWGLVLVLGAYTAKRVSRPTVRSKISGVWTWVKSKTGNVFAR